MVAVPTADGLIVTGKAPVELKAGTVTVAGTVAIEVLLLASETVAPPAGVLAVNASVAEVLVVPVWTVEGLNVIDASAPPGCGGGGGVTVMVAVRVTPLYVAEIKDVAVAETGLVDTKFTTTLLLTPSGTVIVAGTVATAVLLLEKETTAPPAGAFAVSVTVADDEDPPCTLAGLRLTVSSVALDAGGAGAVTVRVAVRVTPLRVAEITDVVVDPTALVATEVVAEVAPAGTVTLAATVAAAGLLLLRDTTAPPDGAVAVSVIVAELVAPPCTVDGLRLTELRVAAVTVHPESLALLGVAEPSFTSTVQSAGGV
jgi:hypothetical protein